MLTLTLVGMVPGFATHHVHIQAGWEDVPVLNENGPVMIEDAKIQTPREPWDMVKISRRQADGGRRLTWIGYYRFLKRSYLRRDGAYHGIGVWLCDSYLSGKQAVHVLRNLLRVFHRHIPEGDPINFRLRSLNTENMGIEDDLAALIEHNEKPLNDNGGLSCDRFGRQCFIDLSDARYADKLEDVVTACQTHSWFSEYSSIFISCSKPLARRAKEGGLVYIGPDVLFPALEQPSEPFWVPTPVLEPARQAIPEPEQYEMPPERQSEPYPSQYPVERELPEPLTSCPMLLDLELSNLRDGLRREFKNSEAKIRNHVYLSKRYHVATLCGALIVAVLSGVISPYLVREVASNDWKRTPVKEGVPAGPPPASEATSTGGGETASGKKPALPVIKPDSTTPSNASGQAAQTKEAGADKAASDALTVYRTIQDLAKKLPLTAEPPAVGSKADPPEQVLKDIIAKAQAALDILNTKPGAIQTGQQ